MIIGVVKEARVAETTGGGDAGDGDAVAALGYEVVVDPGAGLASSFPDAAYVDVGATLGDALAVGRRLRCERAFGRAVGRSW